jgi:hypothetical protein
LLLGSVSCGWYSSLNPKIIETGKSQEAFLITFDGRKPSGFRNNQSDVVHTLVGLNLPSPFNPKN